MSTTRITWQMIDAAMDSFKPTSGGYSLAKRGIVTLASGERVFIKLATNDDTKKFIAKELAAYRWLKKKGYTHLPEILLERTDGFVLPDLSRLDWSNQWTVAKIDAVFLALDELSGMQLSDEDLANLSDFDMGNGWQELIDEPASLQKLLENLQDYPDYANAIKNNLKQFAQTADSYLNEKDQYKLIHADVRADNLAYDPNNHTVQLIDWNWMGMGRKGIEDVALLVNIAHSGFSVEDHCSERIDPIAALALAGFWFSRSTRRIWEGGNPELRTLQFKSALQSSKWAQF